MKSWRDYSDRESTRRRAVPEFPAAAEPFRPSWRHIDIYTPKFQRGCTVYTWSPREYEHLVQPMTIRDIGSPILSALALLFSLLSLVDQPQAPPEATPPARGLRHSM
jgi:hypothetical protein